MELTKLDDIILETMIEKVAITYRVKCDEVNLQIIKQMLLTEFCSITSTDFDNAFIKHSAGRFTISDDDKNNKPYGDLSAYFVSSVLNKYRYFKGKEKLKERANINKMQKIEYNKLEGKEMYVLIKKLSSQGRAIMFCNWNAAFRYLTEEIIALNKNEYQNFIYDVKRQLKLELNTSKVPSEKERIKNVLRNEAMMRTECRKRYLLEHFRGNKKIITIKN